jgi:tol-pal system protein YbgF
MKQLLISLSILCFLFSNTAVSLAAQNDSLNQKVDQLDATTQKNNQDLARALNSLGELQQEVRGIKGRLDSNQYIMKESDRVYQDLDLRVSSLEDKINQIHHLLKDLQGTGMESLKRPSAKNQVEYEEFQKMLNLVNAQDFQAAASGFLGFIKKYPKSEYAGSAQFWVADSFYMLGDYVRAISEFQKLSENDTSHPRVREGIYKQGLSFMRLKKYSEARLFFQKVMASFPNSAEAFQAKARIIRLEELEKGTISTADAKPTRPTPTADHPIMKPSPMPGTPTNAPTTNTPTTTPTSSLPEPSPSSTQGSQVPLY